jgi:WXG100 family type VII secretion target
MRTIAVGGREAFRRFVHRVELEEEHVSTIGAEMGQLEQLGQTFSREGQNVQQLTSAITTQVQNTWWKGPAATKFQSSWESDFRPTMMRLQAALQEASQEIKRRHDALTQAGT